MLPNVGPYIYDVNISGFTRNSIYIYDISRLRFNDISLMHRYKQSGRWQNVIEYHTAACTSLPEDEYLDDRNMSKTL
jgi:hypothetical protein